MNPTPNWKMIHEAYVEIANEESQLLEAEIARLTAERDPAVAKLRAGADRGFMRSHSPRRGGPMRQKSPYILPFFASFPAPAPSVTFGIATLISVFGATHRVSARRILERDAFAVDRRALEDDWRRVATDVNNALERAG